LRTLTNSLSLSQRIMSPILLKLVLNQQGGAGTQTYSLVSTDQILALGHPEQGWGQTAEVLITNRSGNLTALDLGGYSGVFSYGYNDATAGDEFSATAPLTVIAQDTRRIGGDKMVVLTLAGLFNLWGEQEASVAYTPDRINTDTIKTILDAIAGATLTPFTDYPAHTITYDSGYDDSIINAFAPADTFKVAKSESRLSAFQKALAYTKTKSRVENDSGTATIHIFQPTRTGAVYDFEYKDTISPSNHNFFEKSIRERLVLPNRVIARNHPSHTDSFTGTATNAASYAALNNQYYTRTIYVRASSNAECQRIAEAEMQNIELAAERGYGKAPMNVGQEVMDYINIDDTHQGDSRAGNIGFLNRWYNFRNQAPNRFGLEFRFGRLLVPGLAGTIGPRDIATGTTAATAESIRSLWDNVLAQQATIESLIDYLLEREQNVEYQELSVVERFQGPMGANKFD
ncbi:hypothetical protein LCGC14_2036940, partial [marine sediment metagenome]